MQIALTKKLADALGGKYPATDETVNPLFTWTANWITVWSNRRAEDMLVLVNNATRFTVAIYEVKRKNLKNVENKVQDAIANTLLKINLNPELVNEYMRLAGQFELVRNNSRQKAAWVTRAGLDCAFHVGNTYNGIAKIYSDTCGALLNYRMVNYSGSLDDGFYPYKAMIDALKQLTGMDAYKCRAFELMVSLDLHEYKAERRIIVPANMELGQFHLLLQYVFAWENYHLFDFIILDEKTNQAVLRLVPYEEDLKYDESAVLMEGHTLEEFFPEYKYMGYTYDLGDNWKHLIHLVQVIEEYDGELPYLLEASGQTPPEDVGGVGGFLSFKEILQNPEDPYHEEMKAWAGNWTPELEEWQRTPKVIHI